MAFDASARGLGQPDPAILRLEGDYWTIAYAGTVVRIRHGKGFDYLARLLRAPGRVFHVSELTAADGASARRRSGVDLERARKAVTNRIRDAVKRIGVTHESLGLHLRNAIHTGTSCSYTPEGNIRWEE
jgi:hypothetical protein